MRESLVIQTTKQPRIHKLAMAATFSKFHAAIGHAATQPKYYIDPKNIPSKPASHHCSVCTKSKSMHSTPEPLLQLRATKHFKYLHSDLSNKFSVASIEGSWYYMSIIYNCCCMSWVYFLKKKSNTYIMLLQFFAMIKRQYNASIKMFHNNHGREYIDTNCQKLFTTKGIIWELSPAYVHESNKIVEKFNCTITTMAKNMIMDLNLPKFL